MNFRTFNASLTRDTKAGLALRVVMFLIVSSLAIVVALFLNQFFSAPIRFRELLAIWLIVNSPMAVGVVLSELPRGSDWVLFRLAVATFCRTGLPLLFVLIVGTVSGPDFLEKGFGFLSFFYVVGFLASLWLSISRLNNTSDSTIGEVNGAAV